VAVLEHRSSRLGPPTVAVTSRVLGVTIMAVTRPR
jgi:hypothetical protein